MQKIHYGPLPAGPHRREFLEQQPTYWLKLCYQALRRTVEQGLRAYGLTLPQRDVLLALYQEGPLDQSALRDRLGLEQSSVSRLVDGLVRRELVELQAGESDRRVRIAHITTSGRELLLQTPGSSELGGHIMLDGLDSQERTELVQLLRRCADNLISRETVTTPNGAEQETGQ